MTGRALRWLLSLVRRPSLHEAEGPRLTILRHHRIYGDDERPLYRLGVSERVFAAQLEWLARMELRPVTVAAGLAWLASAARGHCVALSFDDAYEDNVTRALPLLERHGASATFYVPAGWVEARRAPWWDELSHALERTTVPELRWTVAEDDLVLPLTTRGEREAALARLVPAFRLPLEARDAQLAELRHRLRVTGLVPCALATWEQLASLKHAHMELGAHTLRHPHLTLLTPRAQRDEIGGSVELIERRLGVRPSGFAYPGGDHDRTTLHVVEDCGLAYAVTTRAGVNGVDAARFGLRRRAFPEAACLDPTGRFSESLATAELHGAFDRLRGAEEAA